MDAHLKGLFHFSQVSLSRNSGVATGDRGADSSLVPPSRVFGILGEKSSLGRPKKATPPRPSSTQK